MFKGGINSVDFIVEKSLTVCYNLSTMKTINKTEKWALVTGASGGVGKEIAKILAKKGWNLVLVARSESKLSDLSKELIDNDKIDVKVFSADLASDNSAKKVFDFCCENNIVVEVLFFILIFLLLDWKYPFSVSNKISMFGLTNISSLSSLVNLIGLSIIVASGFSYFSI